MNIENNAVYSRLTVILKTHDQMRGIYGEGIRKGLTMDGLFDDKIAHNHEADGTTVTRYPKVFFRKGNQTSMVIVGINEGAEYLRKQPLHVGEKVRLVKPDGSPFVTSIESRKVFQSIDYIRVGGFNTYRTHTPIIVAKGGQEWMRQLQSSDGGEHKKLVATCIAKSMRWQIANLGNVDVGQVPKIRVVFDSMESKLVKLKGGTTGMKVHARFGCNVFFSGSKFGVGIGRYTTHGYGVIGTEEAF